ncbi:MAG: hypothetical protein ACOYN0_13910, partial [Phycisphaerales bacterium]
METMVPNCGRLASEVRRRAFLVGLVRAAGWTLTAGASVMLGAAVLDRAFGAAAKLDLPWVPVGAGVTALSVAAAGLLAWNRRWSLTRAARSADAAFKTDDAVSSALTVEGRADPAVAGLVRARGEQIAPGIDPRRVVPLGSTRLLWVAAALAAASAGVLRWVPQRAWAGTGERAIEQVERKDALAQIREAANLVAPSDPAAVANPDAGKAAEELKQIEDELGRSGIDERRALTMAAERLQKAADEAERSASESERREDAMRRAMSEARERPGAESSELGKSLREGDFELAAQRAAELSKDKDQLTEKERRELAEELEDLAETVDA